MTLGRAIDNTLLRVVDEAGEDCLIGQVGELWIGGYGVALEYWQRPELNARQFTWVTRKSGDKQRFYHTGDLVRWLSDGSVEYLGRLDDQIKLRGNRIEVGEIESQIVQVLGERDAAVVLHETQGEAPHLVAFYIPDADGQVLTDVQRQKRLQASLPDYMIPERWWALDALPQTTNNKVDRKALRQRLDQEHAPSVRQAAVPSVQQGDENTALSLLSNMAAEVINKPVASLDTGLPFNLMGFDSMDVVKLTDVINDCFSIELSPTDLYNHPTLLALAELVEQRNPKSAVPSTSRAVAPPQVSNDEFLDSDVAIIGMAGQFPGADNVEQFWQNLIAGHSMVSAVPPGRWSGTGFDGEEFSQAQSGFGGFLKNIDQFDPAFFGMTPHEAACTDPQQRLFLMNC